MKIDRCSGEPVEAQIRRGVRGKCRHFNGVQHEKCRAGVRYDEIRGAPVSGRGYGLPCFSEEGCTCPSFEGYGEQDIQAEIERNRRFHEKLTVVLPLLASIKAQHKPGEHGTQPCPLCDKTLVWAISGYNGHVRAKCATSGCVEVIE